jgi:hypothetical protein
MQDVRGGGTSRGPLGQPLEDSTGYFGSLFPERQLKVPLDEFNDEVATKWFAENQDLLNMDPRARAGGWISRDKVTGDPYAYMDISVQTPFLGPLRRAARRAHQLAIWDGTNMRELPVLKTQPEGPLSIPDWSFEDRFKSIPTEDTRIRFTHRSPREDLTVLDPDLARENQFMPGNERVRQTLPGYKNRIYVTEDGQIVERELQRQPGTYEGEYSEHGRYHLDEDPEGFRAEALAAHPYDRNEFLTALEGLTTSAGYEGYRGGHAAVRFGKTPVRRIPNPLRPDIVVPGFEPEVLARAAGETTPTSAATPLSTPPEAGTVGSPSGESITPSAPPVAERPAGIPGGPNGERMFEQEVPAGWTPHVYNAPDAEAVRDMTARWNTALASTTDPAVLEAELNNILKDAHAAGFTNAQGRPMYGPAARAYTTFEKSAKGALALKKAAGRGNGGFGGFAGWGTPGWGSGGTKLGAVMAPVAGASMIKDDPDSNWDELARVGLLAAGGAATVKWFPKGLAKELKALQAAGVAAELPEAKIKTSLRQHLKALAEQGKIPKILQKFTNTEREALFSTPELPVINGVNFDKRVPTLKTLVKDGKSVRFSKFTKPRLDVLYDMGKQNTNWGTPDWIGAMTGWDVEKTVKFARLLGAYSTGQDVESNTLQAAEAFARLMMGEDPASKGLRTGMTRNPRRPSAISDNIKRAWGGGRIFNRKSESLAAGELGSSAVIPVDLWFMRAIGAAYDSTPGDKLYESIAQAAAKEAAEKGESLFHYMAKVWTGIREVAGRPEASFLGNAEKAGFAGLDLTQPANAKYMLDNARAMSDRLSLGTPQAELPTRPKVAGAAPPEDIEGWRKQVLARFDEESKKGKHGDILGKKQAPRKKKQTLDDIYAEEFPDAATGTDDEVPF